MRRARECSLFFEGVEWSAMNSDVETEERETDRRRFWAISPSRRVFWKASCRLSLDRLCITTLTDRFGDEMSYFPNVSDEALCSFCTLGLLAMISRALAQFLLRK